MNNNTSWITHYLGKPFQNQKDGPDAYDCWGLLRSVYRDIFHIHIPTLSYPPRHQQPQHIAKTSLSLPWIPASQPQHGHAVLFAKHRKNIFAPEHIGIILTPTIHTLVLHALFPHGVVCEPLERITHSRGLIVYGFFQHSSQNITS